MCKSHYSYLWCKPGLRKQALERKRFPIKFKAQRPLSLLLSSILGRSAVRHCVPPFCFVGSERKTISMYSNVANRIVVQIRNQCFSTLMACLNTLKLEIKTLEQVFPKSHERFQIMSASVDELTCRFVGKNGKKYEIHANITVSSRYSIYYTLPRRNWANWRRN